MFNKLACNSVDSCITLIFIFCAQKILVFEPLKELEGPKWILQVTEYRKKSFFYDLNTLLHLIYIIYH